ncbi:unnamed protein product [Boreogadus saida]
MMQCGCASFVSPLSSPYWSRTVLFPDWAYKPAWSPGSRQVQLWHFLLELLGRGSGGAVGWGSPYMLIILSGVDSVRSPAFSSEPRKPVP